VFGIENKNIDIFFVCCLSAPCLFVCLCLLKPDNFGGAQWSGENQQKPSWKIVSIPGWLLFVSRLLLLQCVKNGTSHKLTFSKLAH